MSKHHEPRPQEIVDPRTQPDFHPSHYPCVNGREGPPAGASDHNDRIKLEFLAAYYVINRAYAGVLETRSRADSPARRNDERKRLQAVEQALIVRDSLEDHYAPFGVIAEPVVKNGFTVDLTISFGNVDAAGRHRSDCYTITACVPIPLPREINFEELPIKIEGPGISPGQAL
jgi:hypothetical protein